MRATIKLKLAATFTLITVLAGVMAWLGISSLGALDASMENLIKGQVRETQIAGELDAIRLRSVRSEKNMILSDTPEQIGKYDADIEKQRNEFSSRLIKLQQIASGESKQKLAEIPAAWQAWIATQDKVRNLAKHNGQTEAKELSMAGSQQLTSVIGRILDGVIELNHQSMERAETEASRQYETARQILLAVAAGVLLIAITAGVWVSLSISRGLGRASALANAVAIGDLDQQVQIQSNDEIKDLVDALNRMTANLHTTAQIADAIAEGNLQVEAKPLSGKDTLGLSLKRMLENLRTTAKVADAIADGDLKVEAKPLSDKDVLGLALLHMVERLRVVVGRCAHGLRERFLGQPGVVGRSRRAFLRRHRAGIRRRTGIRFDGRDGRQHQAERRQRRPDREDRPAIRGRRRSQRQGRHPRRAGDADHRREDHHRAGDRPADRPAGPQRGGGSGARR